MGITEDEEKGIVSEEDLGEPFSTVDTIREKLNQLTNEFGDSNETFILSFDIIQDDTDTEDTDKE
jgi:hypothetical protein